MKRIYFLLAFIFCLGSLFAQPCLPGGITFTTQQELDDFIVNYPNCTEVSGNVSILGSASSSSNINDLNGLNQIASIGGSLTIRYNDSLLSVSGLENLKITGSDLIISANHALLNLSGLDSLTTVGGNLRIGGFGSLAGNNSLTNITALNNLSSVSGTLQVSDNPLLTSISGIGNIDYTSTNLIISYNPSLSDCGLLNICNYLNSGGNPAIFENAPGCATGAEVAASCTSPPCPVLGVVFTTQAQIDSFSLNYPGCTEIADDVFINGSFSSSSDITNLNGLNQITSIGGALTIKYNDSLLNLSGLENLSYIQSDFFIEYNNVLLNLSGLDSLTTVGGDLSIGNNYDGNNSLTDITALSNLSSVGGTLRVRNNPLLTSLSGLENIDYTEIGTLVIRDNSSLSTCGLLNICNYLNTGGNHYIYDNALGCATAIEVGASCTSLPCPVLQALFTTQAEIDNFSLNYPTCTEIVGDIRIQGNTVSAITNLNGLSSITSITGNIIIRNNAVLTGLSGLENIQSIFGELIISNNDNLVDFQGLDNVLFIQEECIIDSNNAITDFTGMEKLAFVGGHLTISNNDNLMNFEGLNNLVDINENLEINGNSSLASLDGLEQLDVISERMYITNNPSLINLNGLKNLERIGYSLHIQNNDALTCLPDWNLLETGTALHITDNNNLETCSVAGVCNYFSGLFSWGTISNNAPGCNTKAQVLSNCISPGCSGPADVESCSDIQSPTCLSGGIAFTTQAEIDDFITDYPGCISVLGDVSIQGGLSISNLAGLNQIEYIDGSLIISNNDILMNLNGLENLKYITGNLDVLNNSSLIDIYGLNNICQVGGSLSIIGNDGLLSIIGLNMDGFTGIEIGNNPNLVICNIFALCADMLQGIDVYNNGIGCNFSNVIDFCIPLSVELTSFQAEIQNRTVLLRWETATETNNKGFDIERSRDGTNWQKIGWQDGQGNSYISYQYKHIDEAPFSGTSYYRLRQVDFDGKFSYSDVESVRFDGNNTIGIYPNPSKGLLNLSGFDENGNKQIIIHDSAGRTVLTKTQTSSQVNVSTLVPGIYMMVLTAEEDVFYWKFIVN